MRTLADLVPLRTPACRDAADAVAILAAGESGFERRAGDHVASCLRCQAEVAAYRRVLAIMRSMRDDVMAVPTGAVAEAVRAMQDAGAASAAAGAAGAGEGAPGWAVRVAYVGGITAASAAGVLVWFSRRRLGLPHAS